MSTANLEEAATVAAEYIYSIENLPAEVQFLLSEMKVKDTRVQELHGEIQKEGSKYIRHSLRAPPNQPLSAKDTAIPALIRSHFAEIDKLGQEKEQLAQRVAQLVARAQARLDRDLNRVLTLQGEPQLDPTPAYYYYGASRDPVAQLNESLRSAISIPEIPTTPTPSAQSGPPQKKRRVAAAASAGSIKLPSPAPATVPATQGAGAAGQRSRLSQQVHSGRGRRATASIGPDADEDAEGEDDIEDANMDENVDEGEPEDKSLYCFCQERSYGEMIACDNPECPYQWFHLSCVNIKMPLPETWYCSECTQKLGVVATVTVPERRKGRKKQ